MTKQEKLIEKIDILLCEYSKLKTALKTDKHEYIDKLYLWMKVLRERIEKGELQESEGRTLAAVKSISQFDDIANIKSLFDAAYEVDKYYAEECKSWE